jgi:Tol biopolymer transport system component/predicted Ser/Thr protein kinase
MPLSQADRLGPYEILAPIGAGGMGEVYRARDTRLGREVAIKVANEKFSERFEREARSIAALNHPNICHVYDVGPNYLVMELIDGQPLRGPLPAEKALDYARQIADGLRAAHDRGITHRDLKPANILVTSGGGIKILDFGLAKTADANAANPENSPTLTLSQTQAGMIIGTAAYMAPEQARGKPVDHRADIWAFGCVLYEMLTGKAAFRGETIADILAAVVTKELDLTAVPLKLRGVVKRCLEKDPQKRLRDIGDLDLLLVYDERSAEPRRRWVASAATGLCLAILALGLYLWIRQLPAPHAPVTRFVITLDTNEELTDSPAISSDGRLIAYASHKGSGDPHIYLRNLSGFEAREVAGTSGGAQPFFSPDGRWLGFFAQGQLQKVEIGGGAPIKLAAATFPFGGTFLEDGSVIYVPDETSGLMMIRPGRGEPESLTRPDGNENGHEHIWPEALPGGSYVLFSIGGKNKRGIALYSMKTRQWQLVVPGVSAGAAGAQSGSSVRVFVNDLNTSVKAAVLNFEHPTVVTAERTVLDNVNYEAGGWRRMALAVSRSGSAVYVAGDPGKRTLVWVDRTGRIAPAADVPAEISQAVLSPNGHKVLVQIAADLWVYDLDTGARRRLTFYGNTGMNSSSPMWSTDGSRVIYSANEGVDYDIFSLPADGSRPAERLLKRPYNQYPTSLTPDGTLLFGEGYPDGGEDLYTLSPDGKVAPVRVTKAFSEVNAEFSPDGHRLVYQSDESGRNEVYVEDYPGGGHRVVVSTDGGTIPMWSRDGKELFYVSGEAVIVTAAKTDGSFGPGRKLFDRSPYNFFWHSYDPAPDGKRLLMVHRDVGSIPREIRVILNWGEELNRLMATGQP